MMDKQVDKYYNKYKRGIINLLAFSGIWPDTKQPLYLKIFLGVFALFAEFSVTLGIVNFCINNITNINILTRGLGLMISFSSAFFKAAVMVIHRKDVIFLNCGLSKLYEKDLELPENRPHLLALFPSFHKYFVLHYFYTGMIIFLMIISPILALRHGKYIRAYPQYVPISYEPGDLTHWAIYAYEFIEGFYCWTNTVGVDSAFGLYSLHLVGELRLLSVRFKNLSNSKNYRIDLKDCIDRHCKLTESRYAMQKVFGFLSVWLAVTCAIVLCAIIFQSSDTKSMSTYKVVYLIVYSCIKLIQAYTYAFFGNIINIESENCIDAIYETDWAGSGNLRLMNDVLIIQSQNPMFFDAMSIMIVRLDMFCKIMNASVSYFFLLKTLDEKTVTSQ